jgi:hypothetical protein
MRQWTLAAAALLALLTANRAALAAEEAAPPASAAEDSAYTERLKEIRLIEIKYLRANDEKLFQAGREKLMAIDDTAAVKPLVHVIAAFFWNCSPPMRIAGRNSPGRTFRRSPSATPALQTAAVRSSTSRG